ncbi:MAG: GNAT family N-acetyltransferase [Longicatena sp.]
MFKDNGNFLNLFYCATNKEQLSISLFQLRNNRLNSKFVVDIIGDISTIELFSDLFLQYGYEQYTELFRMSRIIAQVDEDRFSLVDYACVDDAHLIAELLNMYFDPLCEQLPLLEEVYTWIKQKHLLVTKDKNIITGFLIFDLIGKTSYLRYWFTHPEYRDKKIGSLLLRKFFVESRDCRRQLFWVLKNNDNAIKRYEHYGFKAELIHDKVLISK